MSNKIWNGTVAVDLSKVISIVFEYLLSQIFSFYLNKKSPFCAAGALESIFQLFLRLAWSVISRMPSLGSGKISSEFHGPRGKVDAFVI